MGLRRAFVVGMVLTLLSAPALALACEVRCDAPGAAVTMTEAGSDCHQPGQLDPTSSSRFATAHDCTQHAAPAAVPAFKAESARTLAAHIALLVVDRFTESTTLAIHRPSASLHDLAPPGATPRLLAPLRI